MNQTCRVESGAFLIKRTGKTRNLINPTSHWVKRCSAVRFPQIFYSFTVVWSVHQQPFAFPVVAEHELSQLVDWIGKSLKKPQLRWELGQILIRKNR
ncbi:hypothetical protein [Spirosoma flavum]|uniref:Spondin domain-containing protein n=1 Tax=Spirosoma flavum TaxID=2048557 RepID=A0ABW6ADV8_9BACT